MTTIGLLDVLSLDGSEKREIQSINKICAGIKPREALSGRTRARLLALFSGRFENAEDLVKKGAVSKFVFKPSGRVIWTVKGRGGEYQVIPNSNFCNCDDYYFRVMDRQKQLCYHIIAQKLAESLQKFGVQNLSDSQYGSVTRKWRTS